MNRPDPAFRTGEACRSVFLSLFKGWRWGDYVQFAHSLAFVLFGFLILVRLRSPGFSPGYVIGFSFLFFGLYRLKMFVRFFSQAYKDLKKGSVIRP
ncbi:MAG: hypothetical protein ACYDBV_10455 [Nitrospiria bacterium]